jgi:hypothetical protein
MKDLTNPFCIKPKVLLLVARWSFCRFYDFAFYVLERYLDPTHRFSGLSRWRETGCVTTRRSS